MMISAFRSFSVSWPSWRRSFSFSSASGSRWDLRPRLRGVKASRLPAWRSRRQLTRCKPSRLESRERPRGGQSFPARPLTSCYSGSEPRLWTGAGGVSYGTHGSLPGEHRFRRSSPQYAPTCWRHHWPHHGLLRRQHRDGALELRTALCDERQLVRDHLWSFDAGIDELGRWTDERSRSAYQRHGRRNGRREWHADGGWGSRPAQRRLRQPNAQPGANVRQEYWRYVDRCRSDVGFVYGRLRPNDQERQRHDKLQSQFDGTRGNNQRLHPTPCVLSVSFLNGEPEAHPSVVDLGDRVRWSGESQLRHQRLLGSGKGRQSPGGELHKGPRISGWARRIFRPAR